MTASSSDTAHCALQGCTSYLLTGCCKEDVGAVQVVGIVLRVAGGVEPSLQSAAAPVGEVAPPWPRGPRYLVL